MRPGIKVTWALFSNPMQSMYPPEQGPGCPPPTPELNWGWSRAWNCTWPLGCHTLGSLHPLCSQGDQASTWPAPGSETPASRGAQCPTCSSLGVSSLSSTPKCSRCGVTSPGLPQEQGECSAHPWRSSFLPRAACKYWVTAALPPPEEKASPVGLLPSGKPLECEKRHLSCQGGQECKEPLWPAHPAGSELSTCHAGMATLLPHNRAHMPSIASQAFPGTPGHLKEAAWVLPMLWRV